MLKETENISYSSLLDSIEEHMLDVLESKTEIVFKILYFSSKELLL